MFNDDLWTSMSQAPIDPIFGIAKQFRDDTSAHKVDLGLGVYANEQGRRVEPHAVALAREAFAQSDEASDHSYLPMSGHADFNAAAQRLVFGDQPCVGSSGMPSSVATAQTLSGSGALSIGLQFCHRKLGSQVVHVLTPSWPNHNSMGLHAGLKVCCIDYYDKLSETARVDWVTARLRVTAQRGDVLILQACGNNPTGVDFTTTEWEILLDVVRKKGIIPLFDLAYQGLVSGCVHTDAAVVRAWSGHVGMLVAHSFSKSMGLYGERVGSLSVSLPKHLANTNESGDLAVANIASQIGSIVRATYSTAPRYGASVATRVLNDPKLRPMWENEVREMANRMALMRGRLTDELVARGGERRWGFIRRGGGMFTCLGLSVEQVRMLREQCHIYLTDESRINLSGVTDNNIGMIADAICQVSSA